MNIGELKRFCPAAFYTPNKPADPEFIRSHGGWPGSKSKGDRVFFESDASRRVAIGGNRSAKTTKIVLEAGSTIVGCRPWYDSDDPWFMRGLPSLDGRDKRVRVRFVLTSFETQIQEVMDEVRKWWPASWWRIASKNAKGHPTQLDWFPREDGSCVGTLFFMSHNQDTDDFEGLESDLVCWNEPPPKDKWIALHRGLVSSGGRSIVGATPLTKSEWFWEEVVLPYEAGLSPDYLITWHSIWDNTRENGGYERQAANAVRLWLEEIVDPDIRRAREHGAPLTTLGRVLSCFDKRVHVIDDFELPYYCVIRSAIDPAGSRPFAGLHAAYVPDEELEWVGYVFDETFIRGLRTDLSAFADQWNAKEQGSVEFGPFHPHPSDIVIIDPIAEEVQKIDQEGRSLRTILQDDYGIFTRRANRRNKRARLMSLNSRILKGHYKVFRSCTTLLAEIPRWNWDESSAKLTSGPDDLCDCWTYIDNTNPHESIPSEGNERSVIYIPGDEEDQPAWAAVREMREKDKWRYLAHHGMKPI